MKLKQLERLKSVKSLKPLAQLKEKPKRLLSEAYLLSYTATLLHYQMQILRNEIVIKDRTILKTIENEAFKIARCLIDDDLQELEYTKKEINSFYKKVGIKRKI